MSKPNEYDTYIIPPNFIEGGTFFGGLLKLRNTAEALVIVLAIGMPVFSVSALTLTAKIIILCLTALPLGIIALVGINGESLSSFIFLVLKYLCNRRVITRNEEEQDKRKKRRKRKAKSGDDAPKYINPVAEYLPVEKIENGIIYTRDHRYLKIVEVIPINFLLRSAREQRNIIYSFISFLKISPVKMQIKVIAKRADLNRHREIVQQEMAQETDENCRLLQQDYLTLIDRIGAREATSRRFFMVFEYEAWAGRKRENEEAEAIASLQTAARTAVNYLKQCGNEVLIPENDDEFTVDTLYHLLCRNTTTSLPDRVRRIVAQYQEKGLESEIDTIPCTEFFAPDTIDFTNGRHICIDGLYYAYLLVPSTGYKAQVPAGWLSLIVNAGDGIDLDMFISRQPKARMVQRLGQQLRINRSKIKDASDTNTDFDDLDGTIRSGYFLKEGLGNNEDFYYLNLLIAVSAPTVDELEWKVNELKKLLVSRDMDVCSCAFHEEQAFLSSLPLVSMEKHLFERSKRNALTTGVASCYPFMSYELSDENGILFGLNKYNNSPVIIDIFDSKVYKNANIAVCGTSGAGKTSLILLMALRMRRKGIQVFMLAPLKGHEFHRACVNTGGEYISISPASKSCINVLEIRKIDKSVEETLDGPGIERSELAAKIQRLHIFFALLIPDMSYEEKQLLDDALIRTYARKGITHDNAALSDPNNPNVYRQMPVLGDLYDVLREESDTKRLSNIINRFVHGSASTYNYTVSDCNSSVAMQATATGTVTALYRTQSTVPEIHNLARMETITTPVSKTGLAQSLTYAVAKAGYGQTVTIRISKTENGTTYYQDYDIQLLRQLHLSSLTIATKDETLPFVTPKGATARFDRDTTDYYVKVDRETAALYLSGTYPNSSTDTACCGGYYAKVNGVRYDTLAGAEAVLNTELYNEDISVQVCHADTGSIELTYTVHVQKSDPIQLTIQTTPADATVFLTNDLNGKRIVEKNGTYSLTPGASYSYTTTCAGHIGQTVEHYTAPDKDGTLTITLKKAPANDKLINFDSAWPHLRQNNENNGVVDYKTPVYAKDAELYWATSIGSGYDVNACGCPILVDGAIYTYSGSRIYKVDAISGEILIDKPTDHNSSFAINPPTYANGMIFVGLSDGTIQAFDANTLDSLWIYRDSIGGQPNSSIVYHGGYIYTGFWVGEINEAHYVCLSATDEDPTQTMEEKLPTWYYTSKGGFYWAGAYVCDDFLLIGTDDGASGYTTGKPSLLSFNPKTGELLSSYKMNVTGDIRSSITHYNGKYYFTSKGGYFYEATVDEKGTIEDVRTLKLYNYADDPANPAMSTCTPTIYNGRAYIGISGTAQFGAYSGHNLTVIDIPNWEIAYTVRTHGYPQTSGVLTTAYMEETGCVYVYFFDNFTPGKLRVLEDKPGQTEVSLKTMETYTASGQTETYTTPYNIFTPSGAQAQYAICSPIMDEYGTIYFKNDSAYLMAVGSTIERIEVTKLPDKTTYNVKDTFDPTGMQVTAYYANGMTRDVTKYVTWSDKPLKASDTDFQITFPYAMYQNRENSDTLEMECGVHCDKPMTTLTLTIADQSAVKYGDVNADGIIDVSDAMLICQIYLGNVTPTDTQKKAADVNGDGTMDVSDAMMVCQYYLGNITKFPVEQ